MAISKAQLIAQQKYNEKNLDSITFKVKKGKRELYKSAAEARGLGFMEMIRRAVDEYIQNHAPQTMTEGGG